MTELGQRIISALVLAPLVLLVLWWGNPGFPLLVAGLAGIIIWEWNRISRKRGDDAATIIAVAVAGLCVLSVAAGYFMAALVLAAGGGIIAQLLAWRGDRDRLLWVGVLYAVLPASALVVLRADPQWGLFVVLWLLLIVWATDIGAFFAGRWIGGPRLCPPISPKKTWSGAVGGVLAALAVGLGALYVSPFELDVSLGHAVLIAALSVAAQIGDLGESLLKRRFDVKDSSNLIPGHGGVMDRVDGLVAAALVAGLVGIVRADAGAAARGLLLW